MALKITPYDTVDYLNTEDEMIAYLDAILEENDVNLLAAAIGDIARARGMSNVSRDTGLGRESLYKALSDSGNPAFSTIQKVLASLGLRFQVIRADREDIV